MWFRYLVTFMDVGLAGIIGYLCTKDDFETFISGSFMAALFLSSAVLMWR